MSSTSKITSWQEVEQYGVKFQKMESFWRSELQCLLQRTKPSQNNGKLQNVKLTFEWQKTDKNSLILQLLPITWPLWKALVIFVCPFGGYTNCLCLINQIYETCCKDCFTFQHETLLINVSKLTNVITCHLFDMLGRSHHFNGNFRSTTRGYKRLLTRSQSSLVQLSCFGERAALIQVYTDLWPLKT